MRALSHFTAHQWPRRLSVFWLFLAATLLAENAHAAGTGDINVSPKRIVFDAAGHGASVYLFNRGDGPATYSIAVIDRVMIPDGQILSVDDAKKDASEAAYVANFRAETISQYAFNAGTGTLTPKPDRPVALPARSGPRFLLAHPSGRMLYVVNETSNTIAAYAVEEHVRTLSLLALQTASTLPDGWHGRKNQIAEARFGRGGRFLYAINRGHDSVVTFAVDRATGDLSLVGHQPTQGQSPSALAVDPSGHYLFVANQGSRTLATFRLDEQTGAPTPAGTTPVGAAPLSVVAVRPAID